MHYRHTFALAINIYFLLVIGAACVGLGEFELNENISLTISPYHDDIVQPKACIIK